MNLKDSDQDIKVHTWHGKEYLFIACSLEQPYDRNILVIAYPLVELVQIRTILIQLVIGVDIVITILLSVLLYLIIKRLMKPLRYLADATQSIAEGDYSKRINMFHSHDELEILAVKFNSMAIKIEETIHLLKIESEQKQELIDNLAHELRTPLTSISGYADYMRMAELSDDEKLHALDYIKSESKRLEKLSKTLLLLWVFQ